MVCEKETKSTKHRCVRRAFTLIEIVVVIAIVLMLLAFSWLLIGPAIKAKGYDTRIFSDLRQVSAAISIYMSDHDDKLPNQLNDLPASTPRGLPGRETGPNALNQAGWRGPRIYYLVYNQRDANDTEYYNCEYRWNSQDDPIVMAGFRSRATGAKYKIRTPIEGHAWRWQSIPEFLRPHAHLDGHVSWRNFPEEYQNELVNRRQFNLRRP